MDAPYAILEELQPGLARLLAHNPSAFTYTGTQSYFIGSKELAIVDPGPDLPEHIEAMVEVIAGRPVVAIMCTHTHRDHSPASRALAAATGAPIIGCAPLALETVGPRADAAFDGDYVPHRVLSDGEALEVDGRRIVAVATPGHTSNHLCFADEASGALFTGDHVMGWSTTVVAPPDGDMADYISSLRKVAGRDDSVLWPTHGPPRDDGSEYVAALVAHRLERERGVLEALDDGRATIREIVALLYADVPQELHKAAGMSVWSHLLKLVAEGQVEVESSGPAALSARYHRAH